ncbi:MAG: GUN4 domain-containing protein [Leptolyngbya sp. RL_3_1]|nr:GUN4 domain-containing protein [Leptolyngbya sp. RL_3_1]
MVNPTIQAVRRPPTVAANYRQESIVAPRPADAPQTAPPEADDLRSEKGVDYTRLRDLLKAGQWKEADLETDHRMLEAVGRKSDDYIRDEELKNFPCEDLRTIDGLWVKYSQGKWGFSVQKRIYVECGAKLDGKYPGDKIWYEFCQRVGWRKGNSYVNYSDLTFDPSISPAGEFPACRVFVCLLWVGSLVLLSHRDL